MKVLKQCKILLLSVWRDHYEEDNIFNLEGKYVRVAVKDVNSPVEYIGNIVEDNWYNFNDYCRIEEYEHLDENRLREIL